MNLYNFGFLKIGTVLLFASLWFFDSALCMEPAMNNDVLLIGRPEHGGVDIARARENLAPIALNRVWFFDPRSQGESSIPSYFPYPIPLDKPQHFALVCIEKGTLNEVVITFSHHTGSQEPLFTKKEDNPILTELNSKYEEIRLKWAERKNIRKRLEGKIIEEALKYGLIEESIEWGNIYYRIAGKKTVNTFSDATIVSAIFQLKEEFVAENNKAFSQIVSFEKELQGLNNDIDMPYDEMNAVWQKIDSIEKHKNEVPEPNHLPLPEPREPGEVCQHIESFLQEAWRLVTPNGSMIIFSGDARIEETALVNGISKEFLLSVLPEAELAGFEEHSFLRQEYEGERYIGNPALPAITETIGWQGPRDAGSYFLIKKLR